MDTTTFANPMLAPDDEDAEETGRSRPAADELQAEDDDGEDEQDEPEGPEEPEDLQPEGLEEPGGDDQVYVPELEQARKNDSSNYGQYTNRGRMYYRHTQASAGGHTLNPPPDGVKFLMKEEAADKFEPNYVRRPS